MIHYDRMDLVVDNVLLVDVDCPRCDEQCRCEDGCDDVALYDLTILLRNLAIAGALCEAHWQRWYTSKLLCRHWEPGCERTWSRP